MIPSKNLYQNMPKMRYF